MPQRPHDYLAMFPHPESMLMAMRHNATQFMRCPSGHDLPHRVSWGRCSPVDCCDYGAPNTRSTGKGGSQEGERSRLKNTVPYRDQMDMLPLGLERMALDEKTHDIAMAAHTMARSAEAIEVMKAFGQQAAREAAHPLPDLPPAPSMEGKTPQEYVKQRLEDISPWLLEQKIASLRFAGTQKTRDELLAELLDRAGHGRKPETTVTVNAPIIFVKDFKSPYEKQKEEREINNVENQSAVEVQSLAANRGRALLREVGFDFAGEDAAGVGAGAAGEGGEDRGGEREVEAAGGGSQGEGGGSSQ